MARRCERGLAAAAAAGGVIAVRAFVPARLGVVVLESLGSSALERFRRALEEKAGWFGSLVLEPCVVARNARSIAAAMEGVTGRRRRRRARRRHDGHGPARPGVRGGSPAGRPAGARRRAGASGEPALAGAHGDVPVIGMPSCGLFSRATVFDLVLPRLLAGLPVDSRVAGDAGARRPAYA